MNPAEQPPGGPPRLTVAGRSAMLLVTLLASLAIAGLTPVLPQIVSHFSGVPDAALRARMLVTGVGAAMIVGGPLSGWLADRIGRRRVLLLALLLYGVLGAGAGLLDNLDWMIGTRFLFGLTGAAIGTLSITLITISFEGAERNRWVGYYTMTGTFGALLLVPVAGWLGRFGWRMPFALHLLAFPLLILTAIGVRHEPSPPRETTANDGGFFSEFPFGLIAVGMIVGTASNFASLFLPFHLAAIGIADSSRIAAALVPQILIGGTVAFCYGRIRKRLSMRAIFILGFAFCGTGLTLDGLLRSYPLILASQALAGIGAGLVPANLYALAAITGDPDRRARTIGLTRSSFYAGPLIMQLCLEPVAGRYGAGVALTTLGLCLAGGALLFAGVSRRSARHRP